MHVQDPRRVLRTDILRFRFFVHVREVEREVRSHETFIEVNLGISSEDVLAIVAVFRVFKLKSRIEGALPLVDVIGKCPHAGHLVHAADAVRTLCDYGSRIAAAPVRPPWLLVEDRPNTSGEQPRELRLPRLQRGEVHRHGPYVLHGPDAHDLVLPREGEVPPSRVRVARVRSGYAVLVGLDGSGIQPFAKVFAVGRLGFRELGLDVTRHRGDHGRGVGEIFKRGDVDGPGSERGTFEEPRPDLPSVEGVIERCHVVLGRIRAAGVWQVHRALGGGRAIVDQPGVFPRDALPLMAVVGPTDGDVELLRTVIRIRDGE
mmetsp:Transcript_27896/g.67219  ORF Transcript_27896/g.67219 Transcript_27896/m.67219 type:complete len:317 (-) Transcript_27896:228-1178(-)